MLPERGVTFIYSDIVHVLQNKQVV